MKTLKTLLHEKLISKFKETVQVVVTIDKTFHADERQYRHGIDDKITDEEIVNVGKKASDKLIKLLVFDKANIDDAVVVYDRNTDLNLVCIITNPSQDIVELKIVTVMKKKDFKPKPGTKKLIV